MSYLDTVVPALLANIPVLIGWLIGIVLATLMLIRREGRAKRFDKMLEMSVSAAEERCNVSKM